MLNVLVSLLLMNPEGVIWGGGRCHQPTAVAATATRAGVGGRDRDRPLEVGVSGIQTIDEPARCIATRNGRYEFLSRHERRAVQLGALRLLGTRIGSELVGRTVAVDDGDRGVSGHRARLRAHALAAQRDGETRRSLIRRSARRRRWRTATASGEP